MEVLKIPSTHSFPFGPRAVITGEISPKFELATTGRATTGMDREAFQSLLQAGKDQVLRE